MHCGMPKGTSQAEASEKNQALPLLSYAGLKASGS